MTETLDALFIPVYVNVDRWDNDSDGDLTPPSMARRCGVQTALSDDHWKDEIDLVVDGKLYDFSRFLSLVRYGTTNEYARFDPFNLTLLSGSYYLNLLHRHGYAVRVANVADRHTLERLGRRYAPRFVMLSTTLALDSNEHEMIPMAVRQIRRQWPEAVVVLGGLLLVSYKNSYPRGWFENLLRYYGADVYVVSAQSEHPALEVLRRGSLPALLDGPPIPSTYVVSNGKVYGPGDEPEPAMNLADSSIRWSTLPQTEHLYHTIHLRTARSCAFKCAFCEYPVNQGPLTLAPVEAIDHELAELKKLGSVKSLIFTDDTFNVPLRRFKELLRVLAKYQFGWYSFFRPQYADEETVRLMKAAGCRAVFAGLESADDQILQNMHKNARADQYRRGIELLKKAGIYVHASFIVGFPGETEQSARKISRFIDEMGIDFTTINTWVYLPSTPIARRASEFAIEGVAMNWRHATMTSQEAQLLARSVAREQKSAIHNSVRGRPWMEFMLYANGFSLDDARLAIGTYNRFIGRDVARPELTAAGACTELRSVLQRHEFVQPYTF
jgi:p-methyltransferase